MTRPVFYFIVVCVAACLAGCEVNDHEKSCCKLEPLVINTGAAKLYVPNAFTPNDDGVNDYFFASANKNVMVISSFKIKKGGSVLFSAIDIPPNRPSSGWPGKGADGKPLQGVFEYEITMVEKTGEENTYTGMVCSRTDNPPPCVHHENHCFFSTQHDGGGSMDPDLPTWESCE